MTLTFVETMPEPKPAAAEEVVVKEHALVMVRPSGRRP